MHLRNFIIYMNLFCLTTAIYLFVYLFIEPGFLYSELRRQKKNILFFYFLFFGFVIRCGLWEIVGHIKANTEE